MDPVELSLHRRNTDAFIAVKPTEIALTPVERTRNTGSGGYKDVPSAPRSAQTFRIIETAAGGAPPIITTNDGKQREAAFLLLGPHDAAIAINDFWTEGSREWSVADLVRANGYETRALVTERGK